MFFLKITTAVLHLEQNTSCSSSRSFYTRKKDNAPGNNYAEKIKDRKFGEIILRKKVNNKERTIRYCKRNKKNVRLPEKVEGS